MSDEFLMKGKVYAEHKHKLVYPVVAEVKYDEIRLHVRRVGDEDGAGGGCIEFLSYAGKPLHNLNHWAHKLWDFMLEQGVHNLDIGVSVNGNFNDSYRWTRSSTGIPREKLDKKTGKIAPALDVSMVQFYLFDWPDSTQPFKQRRVMLDKAASYMRMHGIPTHRPEAWVLATEAEVDQKFTERRELGDEGLMVKALDHTYIAGCGKRIDGWLKMKPDMDFDGVITGVNQAFSIEGVPLDRAGSVDVLMPDGSTASPSGIPHALGRLMWASPAEYVDQWAECSCMERDRKGGYRHPVFNRLREAK